jgi:hypothetical protein
MRQRLQYHVLLTPALECASDVGVSDCVTPRKASMRETLFIRRKSLKLAANNKRSIVSAGQTLAMSAKANQIEGSPGGGDKSGYNRSVSFLGAKTGRGSSPWTTLVGPAAEVVCRPHRALADRMPAQFASPIALKCDRTETKTGQELTL